jgi:hypothetical protein
MLTEYKDYIKKSLRPKRVLISPGVILGPKDCPELPYPSKKRYYRSFVAKLQFAASWIRFDISFVVSQLALFCASAGTPRWAALHHVMEYLEWFPSLKFTNQRRVGAIRDLLSGFADSNWGNSSSRRSTSGNLMLYNKAPIMWKSKMQKTTALSTAEAETIRRQRREARFCTSASSSSLSVRGSFKRLPRLSTETTRRASSGVTTSSADGSEPSTLTS